MRFFFGTFIVFLLNGLIACGKHGEYQDVIRDDRVALGSDFDFLKSIKLSNTPQNKWRGENYGSPYLTDVMSSTKDRFRSDYGPSTMAHESAHGLHAEMRNKLPGSRQNFFFFQSGTGVYVKEPKTVLNNVKNYVPAIARQIASGRYKTYLVDQARSWHEMLYLFDEWTAYIVGSRVAVEISQAGRWHFGSQDALDGMTDFLFFAAAAVQTLKEKEPDYLASETQFKATFAMLAEQSMTYYRLGMAYETFRGFHAAKMMTAFLTSPESAKIRETLREWLGEGFMQRVFHTETTAIL